MAFLETGASGDSRTAPHNIERGPYYHSGHVRVGYQGDLTYGTKGYAFPGMDAYDILADESCGSRGMGGNRWGLCKHWRVQCESFWRGLYDNSARLTDEFVALATADTSAGGSATFNGINYATPAGPCAVRGAFALTMQTIADAIGSFDPWTGLNYPRRGQPGFIDRRVSQIFGGETSRSGLIPDPYGDLGALVEEFWMAQDADDRMRAYDDQYTEVQAAGLLGPGDGAMPNRQVRAAGQAVDGGWLYSSSIARMTGNASFCRHIVPRSYAECSQVNDKGQCNYGTVGRWVTPLSGWDDKFGELRQRLRGALAAYQEIPEIAAAGGVQEACSAQIALVPQGAASPEANQDMAAYVQLEVDRQMVEKGELFQEERTEVDEQIALMRALEAQAAGSNGDGAATNGNGGGMALPAKLAMGGAATVAAVLLWRRLRK